MSKRPLIIDCDPGMDDAQCIMMLQASGLFDIKGITATHGNVPLDATSKNALYLSDYYGINCPVYVGAEEALIVRNPRAGYVHGANGLGGYEYNIDHLSFADGKAWDFLYETAVAEKGELELIAIGPLTNVAITIMKHPDFPKLIKKFVIMGGARTAGNATPLSEFNIYQDPHACEIVLQAGFEDFTVVDLQCCFSTYLNRDEQDRLINTPQSNKIHALMSHIAGYRALMAHENQDHERVEKMIFCDAVAAAVLIDPTLTEYQPYFMTCETRGSKAIGQTILDRFGLSGKTNIKLALAVDRDRYASLYFDCLGKYEG